MLRVIRVLQWASFDGVSVQPPSLSAQRVQKGCAATSVCGAGAQAWSAWVWRVVGWWISSPGPAVAASRLRHSGATCSVVLVSGRRFVLHVRTCAHVLAVCGAVRRTEGGW